MQNGALPRSQRFEASEDEGSNPANTETIGDVIARRLSRREAIGGLLAAGVVSGLPLPATSGTAVAQGATGAAATSSPAPAATTPRCPGRS